MSRVLVALALAAVSAVASAQPQLKPLNVIVFPGGWNLPIWAAERQGFFEQNGLRVTVTPTPSSTSRCRASPRGASTSP